MAYWRLTTYTRPDNGKEFYIRRTVAEVKTASVIGAKIVEFENAGKITHYSINYSADLLTQKIKMGFDTEASYNEFKTYCEGEDEYTTLKSDFITNNSLTESVAESAEEPSV